MRLTRHTVLFTVALSIAPAAFAIDRGAAIVERIQVDGAAYSHAESVVANLISENVVDPVVGRWAIVLAAGFGNQTPDGGGDNETWSAGLGLKWYATELTSLTLMGAYRSIETMGGDTAVWGGELTLRQRILPAEAPISPYVEWQTACVEVGEPGPDGNRRSFVALEVVARLGLEFRMNDELSLIVEGGHSQSQNIDTGSEIADGWVGTLGVQYYWY